MSSIGARIKEYRLLRGMTQQEIADALGESSGRVIYHWEKGSGRPDCDKLAKLCDLLGVSADELIGCKVMHHRPTATEWSIIQKYRALDEHGKEIVDVLIDCVHFWNPPPTATGLNTRLHFLSATDDISDTPETHALLPHRTLRSDSCASYGTTHEQSHCLSHHPEAASANS